MKILIIGGNGMLGHNFFRCWRDSHDVRVTLRNDFAFYSHHKVFSECKTFHGIDILNFDNLSDIIGSFNPDCIVNCSGITKQLSNVNSLENILMVNSVFPHKLNDICKNLGIRLIQLSTDCVFSGKKGNYTELDNSDAEDIYGKSKFLGEINDANTLTLRKSSIGLELENKHGLVEWFLNQKNSIQGYKGAIYSGFSCTHLALLIENIIINHPGLNGVLNLASQPITKYDLLRNLRDRLDNFSIDIIEDDKIKIDRSLDSSSFVEKTGIRIPQWEEMLDDLANEINERKNDSR